MTEIAPVAPPLQQAAEPHLSVQPGVKPPNATSEDLDIAQQLIQHAQEGRLHGSSTRIALMNGSNGLHVQSPILQTDQRAEMSPGPGSGLMDDVPRNCSSATSADAVQIPSGQVCRYAT